MAVRAKFFVAELNRYAYNPDNAKAVLRPVVRGEENREWAAATPSGEIVLQINNAPAGQWFADRLGKELSITFEDFEG